MFFFKFVYEFSMPLGKLLLFLYEFFAGLD